MHLCDLCLKSLGFSESEIPPDPHFVGFARGEVYKVGGGYIAPALEYTLRKLCPECAEEFKKAFEQFKFSINARAGLNDPRKQRDQVSVPRPELQ